MAFIIPNQAILAKNRPVTAPAEWTRPANWISITNTANEVQFLASDIHPTYTIETNFSRTGSENIYIDWGDGVTDTISTNTTTSTAHTFTTGGTSSGLGYNTWKIRIYGDSGTRIEGARIVRNAGELNTLLAPVSGVLEAYYGDNTVTTMYEYFRGDVILKISFNNLHYVKCPNGLTASDSFYYTFGSANTLNNAASLVKIDMPTSCSANTSLVNTFYNCTSLQNIILPSDMTGLTDMTYSFTNCYSLYSVKLPTSLASVTTLFNGFNGCASLGSIDLPPMDLCTNYDSAFSACRNLLWARIQGFTSTAQTIVITSMFSTCYSLQNINLPKSVTSGTLFNSTFVFNSCYSLISFRFPENFDSANISSMFNAASFLTSVIFPTSMPSLANIASTFATCSSLTDITLPTTVSSSINMSSTFQFCGSLSSITIPSSWNITSLSSTFQNCFSLVEAVLPNNSQNGLTSMAGAFNGCQNLKSVTLPTSLNGLVTLSNAFNSCMSLKSVTLPALPVMNVAFTTSQTNRLTDFNLPSVSNVFVNPISSGMYQYTIPNLTGVTPPTTFNMGSSVCTNLKTLTLPTSGTTSLISATFNYPALTSIVNQSTFGPMLSGGLTWTSSACYRIPSLDVSCRVLKFTHAGTVDIPLLLTSLRLRHSSSSYSGASPQISIMYTSLNADALNQVFTDLPALSGKVINITGCPGAATCTRSIATAKGWTVTG